MFPSALHLDHGPTDRDEQLAQLLVAALGSRAIRLALKVQVSEPALARRCLLAPPVRYRRA